MRASRMLERSLRLIGVLEAGEPMEPQQAQDALEVLNDLLEAWRLCSLLVYARVRYLFPVSAGTGQYTVGPGGTLNATVAPTLERPVVLEDVRWVTNSGPQQLDTPLRMLTEQEYNDIPLKGLQSSWGQWCYYNPTHPLGTMILWPVPTISAFVRIPLWAVLAAIPTIETDVDLPPNYRRALQYNLARELAPEYGVTLGVDTLLLAQESQDALMKVNRRPRLLSMAALRRGGRYNYLTNGYS